MPAKLQLTVQMEYEEFVEVMKNIPIQDVSIILVKLAKYYANDAPPDSPRAKFVGILREGVGILNQGDF